MVQKMSKTDIWMPLYIPDYLADTTRLTTEQHGAYLLLIMDYWRNGPLPDDDAALANITRLQAAAWKKHRPTLARLFNITGGEWRHKRIDKEMQEAAENAKKYEDRARKAAEKRWGKQSSNDAPGNATSTPKALPDQCTSPSPSPCKPLTSGNVDSTGVVPGETQPAAVRIAVNVRAWEKARGKSIALTAMDPRVIAWADAGVTDDQLQLAYEMAVEARQAEGDTTPINAGFLDVFVAKVLKPATGSSAIGKLPPAKPWFMSSTSIDEKGAELGVEKIDGEQWHQWRDRVYAAAGVTAEMIRRAKIDAGERV